MIHAYALEPKVVASWGKREEFRFIHDKFGLGTPRAMLELPAFSKWKRDVHAAALELGLSEEDMKRVEELFRLLGQHKCRRNDALYDEVVTWLENAEREYDRKPLAAILAAANPRQHKGVLLGHQLEPTEARWAHPSGTTLERRPETLATALTAMLVNCRELHLIDPHFGPENARHRKVIEALMGVLARHGAVPEIVRVHCRAKSTCAFFETSAAQMAARLPAGIRVEFRRWDEKDGGDQLHNRYVLTDLGGVSLGVGLDAGREGHTDDISLLSSAQYSRRWGQYVTDDGSFEMVDAPRAVLGKAVARRRVPVE